MITISVKRGVLYSIAAIGHAGGEYGRDIVCAAVSALMQNILVGLESLDVDWKYSMDDGKLEITFTNSKISGLDKAIFLFETTLSSIKEIALAYTDKIKIMERNNDEIV